MNSAAVTGCRDARPAKSSISTIALALARRVRHHGEGADVHERVGGQVEHGGGDAGLASARVKRHQHVAGMRDGTVGQHALELVWRSAAKLPMIMVAARRSRPAAPSVWLIGSKAVMKTRRKMAKAAALGPADRNAARARARPGRHPAPRTGTAHAETLKARPTNISAAATPTTSECPGAMVRRIAWISARISSQIRRAGDAVDPGDAVEQKRGGERSQQEVLQRRFIGALVVAQVAGQDVAGDGGDLQADEDHDQLVGRHHHALAHHREQAAARNTRRIPRPRAGDTAWSRAS